MSRLQKCAGFYLSRRQRDGVQSQELLSSHGEAAPVSDMLTVRKKGFKSAFRNCSNVPVFTRLKKDLNSKNLEAAAKVIRRASAQERLSVLAVFRKVKHLKIHNDFIWMTSRPSRGFAHLESFCRSGRWRCA